MSATRFAAIVGGVGVVGYGSYALVQQKEISKYEKEAGDIAAMVKKEKTAVTSAEKSIKEQEGKIAELQKKEAAVRSSLTEVEAKLEEARKVVAQLETEYNSKAEEAQKYTADVKTASSRLASLKSEAARAKEALSLGEKSLQLARQKAVEAKGLMNPLNHPKVMSLMGKK